MAISDNLHSLRGKNLTIFQKKIGNLTAWDKFKRKNATTPAPADEDAEDLTVLGVVWFLIKWVFGVVVQILSLIPSWLLIAIAALIFLRYLMRPSLRLLSWLILKCCFIRICCCCDYLVNLTNVKRTRSLLSKHMMKMKVGVWRNEANSDDEMPYHPLPQEADLMYEIHYDLANLADV